MKTLIIIPAYNEESNIRQVIDELQRINSDIDYIVINDCSNDNTIKILKDINANYIDLPVNLGIGGGVQLGYIYALNNDYDIAVQMDGDGQHDPKYIEKIIDPIINGQADFVIGSRFMNKEGFQSTGMRRFGISCLSILIKLVSGTKIYDVTSGFRAINRKMIKIFANNYAQDYPEPEAIIAAVVHKARIIEVPVIMHERTGGESSITSFKSIYYMIKVSIAIILYKLTFKGRKAL
ncbi:glycosyltransferase family 2 protein [Clostridium beijerinckii]|uniref:glycosyltransferase family 2 protein n=1 Tax=Clostridium beijerinckii TaxID=1520 RepID=UPI0024324E18|nr:glycosyltransferase family 2 protein [Clostridium beijerinckii]MDG5852747.1 glycosyltransferase family 2 protein [Clostridium beijerinckii]